jgi:Zn finger protein HypA/HybF involved in hydrogenase expression
MQTYLNPTITVDHGPDGTLSIRIRQIGGGDVVDVAELILTPRVYKDVVSQMVSQAMYAVDTVERQLVAGPCDTCQNNRLVQDPTKDQAWHIHCPDCSNLDAEVNAAIAAATPAFLATHRAYDA